MNLNKLVFAANCFLIMAIICILFMMYGCGNPCTNKNAPKTENHYSFKATHEDKNGVQFEVYDGLFDDGYYIVNYTNIIAETWNCLRDTEALALDMDQFDCLHVKVTDEYQMSKDGKYQMLMDEAPKESCNTKDFTGPCYWRGAMDKSEPGLLVIPPQASTLSLVLVQYWAQWADPYSHKKVVSCIK